MARSSYALLELRLDHQNVILQDNMQFAGCDIIALSICAVQFELLAYLHFSVCYLLELLMHYQAFILSVKTSPQRTGLHIQFRICAIITLAVCTVIALAVGSSSMLTDSGGCWLLWT